MESAVGEYPTAPLPTPAGPSRTASDAEIEQWTAALRHEREATAAIESALADAAYQARSAEKAMQAAHARIGAILRYARAGQTTGLVDMTRAANLTDISRQALTRWRDNPAPWDELVELARDAGVYGDDHGAETELHARLPWHSAWTQASRYLQQLHDQAYHAANGGFDPMAPLDAEGDAPGVAELDEITSNTMRRLAAGDPL